MELELEEYRSIIECSIINGNTLTAYYFSIKDFPNILSRLRDLHKKLTREQYVCSLSENNEEQNCFKEIKYTISEIKKLCKQNMIDVEFSKDKSRTKYSISSRDISDLIYFDKTTIKVK